MNNISFKSNSLYDTLLYSGMDVNLESEASNYPEISCLNVNGPVYEDCLQQLQTSYDSYKVTLQSNGMPYNEFLSKVKENFSEFTGTSASLAVKNAVGGKLEELANRHINQIENQEWRITRFFQRVMNWFCGNGYNTEGEIGLEMAAQIKEVPLNYLKHLLSNYLISGDQSNAFREPIQNTGPPFLENIGLFNDLSEAQFKEVLSGVRFNNQRIMIFHGQKSRALEFVDALNDEKRSVFREELMKRENWVLQAADIIGGEIDSSDVVEQFIQFLVPNEQHLVNALKKIGSLNEKGVKYTLQSKFLNLILVNRIRLYLEENNVDSFINIGRFLTLVVDNINKINLIGMKRLSELFKLLNEDEVERIEMNTKYKNVDCQTFEI